MPEIVKPITTCRLCGQKFSNYPLDVPIIGEPVTASAQRFVTHLASHLSSKHRETAQGILVASQQLYGFLAMVNYETQDKALLHLAELIRYDIHRSTRKIAISDEHVSKAVAALELPPEYVAKVEAHIRDLRDLLTDSGAYSPQVHGPIIPANGSTPLRTG